MDEWFHCDKFNKIFHTSKCTILFHISTWNFQVHLIFIHSQFFRYNNHLKKNLSNIECLISEMLEESFLFLYLSNNSYYFTFHTKKKPKMSYKNILKRGKKNHKKRLPLSWKIPKRNEKESNWRILAIILKMRTISVAHTHQKKKWNRNCRWKKMFQNTKLNVN